MSQASEKCEAQKRLDLSERQQSENQKNTSRLNMKYLQGKRNKGFRMDFAVPRLKYY